MINTIKENPLLTGMKIIAFGDPISVGVDEIKDVAEKSLAAYEGWSENGAKPIDVPTAMGVLREALVADKSEGSYYYSWQANIAMAFYDEWVKDFGYSEKMSQFIHEISNNAAKRFLDLLTYVPKPETNPPTP